MRDYTDITLILDRSGSMSVISSSAEEMLNGYITLQKKDGLPCKVSLYQFDDSYESVFSNIYITDIPYIKITPRGATALLDAIGKSIDNVGNRLAAMSEVDRPNKVLIVIITDGYENASRYFDKFTISEKIKHQREKYNWEFVFIGANQDAIMTATSMNIPSSHSLNFASNHMSSSGVGNRLYKATTDVKLCGAVREDTMARAFNTVDEVDYNEWTELLEEAKKEAKKNADSDDLNLEKIEDSK